eukprot:2076934-Karenia_brevis.AAC.1
MLPRTWTRTTLSVPVPGTRHSAFLTGLRHRILEKTKRGSQGSPRLLLPSGGQLMGGPLSLQALTNLS